LGYVVSYNTEWVAQSSILYNQSYPDLVVIGEGDRVAGDKLDAVYDRICSNKPPHHRMDRLSAEITKVSLNCFMTAKITMANLIGDVAVASGVDPAPILKAIGGDRRVGDKFFSYGFGYGGPCFPRDNKAIIHYCSKVGVDPLLHQSISAYNNKHLDFQVQQFIKANPDKNKPVIFDSVTYKRGVTIIEESQQLLYAVAIARLGYKVIVKEHPEVIRQVSEVYGNLFCYVERE
jgi:nucleotide sugar dehydrogenase